MAGKPLNRLELRRQNDAAEPPDPMEDESDEIIEDADDDDGAERKTKRRTKAAPKKAKAAKPAKPAARMRIVWVVTNDAFKPVGTFEYSQKEAADARAAELTAKGKGTHFVQKVKEPMPDNAPGLGASIPRPAPAPVAAAVKETITAIDDEEDIEDEDENDIEPDDEIDDEE